TGLARIRRIGLTEAARALLTALLGLLLGVVPVAELSGIVLISHHGTPFLVTGPWAGRAICSWPRRSYRPRAAGHSAIRAVSPLAEATEEADHRTARAGGGARALLPAPTDPNGQNHGDAIAAGVACTAEQAVPWASPPSPHPVPGPIAVMRTPCTARVS